MTNVVIALECSKDAADELAELLRNEADASVLKASRSSLDGSPETILQIVQLALTSVTVVPTLLAPFLDRNKVTRIRVGDVELDNPTPEMVDQLLHPRLEGTGGEPPT